MDSFSEWCWNESQKPFLSQEQLMEIAERLAGQTRLDSHDLENLMQQFMPQMTEQEFRKNPEYKKLQKELTQSRDPLKQQQLREKVAENLEQRLNSPIQYQRMQHPQQELKEGSRVKIRKDSRFASQNSGVGTMRENFGDSSGTIDGEQSVHVKFDDGYGNNYREKDLELAQQFTKQQLEEIAKQNSELMKQASQTPFDQFRGDMEGQVQDKIENDDGQTSSDSKDFRAGDKIRMNEGANGEYDYTKEGSEGEITRELGGGKYNVKFTKQTGAPNRGTETWGVHRDYMEKLQSLKEIAQQMGGSQTLAQKLVQESVDSAMQQMKLKERFVGELKGSKLFRGVTDDSYEVNQLELLEMLGKKEYEDAMEMASFKKKPVRTGKHRSKLDQHNGISARYKKTNRVSSGLAILPTMQHSITRRAVDKTGPVLHEDDLAVYDTEKRVSYAVEFLVDANKCIFKSVSGTKKAALSLYYMMKKFYPGDSYEFIKFNDDAQVVSLDELLTMELSGCRDSGGAVDLGIQRLNKQKGKQRVMYLISDGNPCGWGKGSERQSGLVEKAKELKKKDIQLVMLAICNRKSDFYQYAQEVAREAGGLMYHVPDVEKLAMHTLQSYRDLKKRKT